MLDDDKRLLEELQEKLKEVELKVEDLEESLDSEELSDDPGFMQISSASNEFFLHWIDINETSFSSCSDVDSVEKAQMAFSQASIFRDNLANNKRKILHGDLIVLLCNDSEETGTGGINTYPDACYYIGMCVVTDGVMQEPNPAAGKKIGSSTFNGSEPLKQFVAWYTCPGQGGDTTGHTGDVIESVLGTPTHTATCSGDQTILNLTFPVQETTLTFSKGLLKNVSSPTQGTPITSTIYLPCCCDDTPSCASSVTLQISSIDGLSPSTSPILAVPVPTGNYTSPNCANNYGVEYDETDQVNAPFDTKTFNYSIITKQAANTATYPSGYVTQVTVNYVNITDQYTLVFQKEYIPAAGEGANDVGNPTLGQYPPPVTSVKITGNPPTTTNVSYPTTLTLS
jgi:hypothetical protein